MFGPPSKSINMDQKTTMSSTKKATLLIRTSRLHSSNKRCHFEPWSKSNMTDKLAKETALNGYSSEI